eukprot:UC1_evm1s638
MSEEEKPIAEVLDTAAEACPATSTDAKKEKEEAAAATTATGSTAAEEKEEEEEEEPTLRVWLLAPDAPNIQVLRIKRTQWTHAARKKWLRCELHKTNSFGPSLQDRVIVYQVRDDDEKNTPDLPKNECARKMFKNIKVLKGDHYGYFLVAYLGIPKKGEKEAALMDLDLTPRGFISHCKTYSTQDAEIDWEREYDLTDEEEAVRAHHREFRKIIKKYGLDQDDKASALADFLTE